MPNILLLTPSHSFFRREICYIFRVQWKLLKRIDKTYMQFHSNYVNIFSFDKQMRKTFCWQLPKSAHAAVADNSNTQHYRYIDSSNTSRQQQQQQEQQQFWATKHANRIPGQHFNIFSAAANCCDMVSDKSLSRKSPCLAIYLEQPCEILHATMLPLHT